MSGNTMMNQDQAIQASVTLTRDAHEQFSQQVSAMNTKIQDIGQHWVGMGSVSFQRVVTAWNNQVTRLLSALSEFGDNLEGTDKVFNVSDTEAEQALNKLSSRLG